MSALITTRNWVQFVEQVFGLPLLQKRMPDSARPFKMWLYPLPAGLAFMGSMYIFLISGCVLAGLITLVVGCGAFLIGSRMGRAWPFEGASK